MPLDREQAKTARRTFWGSCEPEWNLFDKDGVYCGFWSEYHDGKLPKGVVKEMHVNQ